MICAICPLRDRRDRPLTGRQADVLRLIGQHVAAHGVAPTLEEIRVEISVRSPSTVHELLGNLEAKGYLVRAAKATRGRSLTAAGLAWLAAHPQCPTYRPGNIYLARLARALEQAQANGRAQPKDVVMDLTADDVRGILDAVGHIQPQGAAP